MTSASPSPWAGGRQEERQESAKDGGNRAAEEDVGGEVEVLNAEALRSDDGEDGGGNPTQRTEDTDLRERLGRGVRHRDGGGQRPRRHVEKHDEQEADEKHLRILNLPCPKQQRGTGEVADGENLLAVQETVGEHSKQRRGDRAEGHDQTAPEGPLRTVGHFPDVGEHRNEPDRQHHKLQEHHRAQLDARTH